MTGTVLALPRGILGAMTNRILVALLFAAAAVPAQGRRPGGDAFPQIGKLAPVFTAADHEGKKVTVGGKSKTWTVLAFYPKALTGG